MIFLILDDQIKSTLDTVEYVDEIDSQMFCIGSLCIWAFHFGDSSPRTSNLCGAINVQGISKCFCTVNVFFDDFIGVTLG